MSFIVSAMRFALPSALLICLVSEAKSLSVAVTMASKPDIPSCPANVAAYSVFCASVSCAKPPRRSIKTSMNGRMFPLASDRVKPKAFMASLTASVGFAIRDSQLRSAVPAWLALMPLLAIRPNATAMSSTLYFLAPATGATYLKDSPSIATLVLDAADAVASTSEKCAASLACNPNAVNASVTMSLVNARSSPEAAARFIIPSRPFNMSSVFHPAMAIYSRACADSVAENLVAMPISLAFSVSWATSSPAAPEMATTLDICASKFIPALTAYPVSVPNAAAAAPVNPFIPLVRPDWSTFVSIKMEPSACANRTTPLHRFKKRYFLSH